MRVDFVWSTDAEHYARLEIPHGISLEEFAELEKAVLLQLSAVRKSLESEQPPSYSADPVAQPHE